MEVKPEQSCPGVCNNKALFATLGWKPMKSKREVALQACSQGQERALVNNSRWSFRVESVAGVEGKTLAKTLLHLAK